MVSPASKAAVAEGQPTTVYSSQRTATAPQLELAAGLCFNERLKMDGRLLLAQLPAESVPVAFLDPQYRGVLDKLAYGNEGKGRGKERSGLPQMDREIICAFIRGISAALMPSGHLFLWMDKFHLCTGFAGWLEGTQLEAVDMVTWSKGRIGMGYRTRRSSEHLVVLQKAPRRAKGVWQSHSIPDVWQEAAKRSGHAHAKPVGLQAELIAAVSQVGDAVIDPAAGSFSVLEACSKSGRNFLGCDISG